MRMILFLFLAVSAAPVWASNINLLSKDAGMTGTFGTKSYDALTDTTTIETALECTDLDGGVSPWSPECSETYATGFAMDMSGTANYSDNSWSVSGSVGLLGDVPWSNASASFSQDVYFEVLETTTIAIDFSWSDFYADSLDNQLGDSGGAALGTSSLFFQLLDLSAGTNLYRFDASTALLDATTPQSGYEHLTITLDPGVYWTAASFRSDVGTLVDGGSIDQAVAASFSVSVVPIPAAVWLFGSALAGLGWFRRRQTA
jgi:hypothetical protein